MNKQDLSNNGGHPLTADDLQFNIDNIVANTKGSMSFLKGFTSNDVVILSGCVITEVGGNYTYTDGYVWMQDEVFYVPALVAPTPIVTVYNFSVVQAVIAAGTKVYKNLSSINTRFLRTASIVSAGGASPLTFDDSHRFNSAWTVVGATAASAYGGGWSGTARYRMRNAKVELDLAASNAAMSGGQRTILTLPSYFYPSADKHFAVKGLDNASDALLMVKVDTAGVVSLIGGATAVAKTVNFNQVSYYLT